MWQRLLGRLHRNRAIDHPQTKDEALQQQGDRLRGPNARTDAWYSGPVSDRSFVDEGRPRK
jgi:hypothetical protein